MIEAKSRALEAFRKRFAGDPDWLVRAPGRVNLLGAHVDYSEGWVLPGALDRSVWLAVRNASGPVSKIHAVDFDEFAELETTWLPPPVPERAGETEGWLDLPRGVAWALRRRGYRVVAIEAAVASDVPIGGGVSSSAAIEVAFSLAWESVGGYALAPEERALLAQRVENKYLGVQSGVMDPFASIHGRPDELVFLDCRDLTFEYIPVPAGCALVIAESGVRRTLAGSGYNSRPEECRQAVDRLRKELPGIKALRDVGKEELASCAHVLSPTLYKRATHAVEECERVRAGARYLEAGNAVAFGELMRKSHVSSRDLYEVSTPELDALAYAAWSAPGCYGARLIGAGFGGCVAALAKADATAGVESYLKDSFKRSFGKSCHTFVAQIGAGASASSY